MVAVKEMEALDNKDGPKSLTGSPPMTRAFFLENGNPEWKNRSFELFKEKLGEELYVRLRRLEVEEAKDYENDSGLFSMIGDMFQQVKADLFSPTMRIVKSASDGYPRPVGGCGFAKVVSTARFPEHPFFSPGRIFRSYLRHCNLSEQDDAAMDGRVTALRIEDEQGDGGRLDLILYTGAYPPYQNAENFQEYMDAMRQGSDSLRQWIYKKPSHHFAQVEQMRRCPDSFYDLRYHTHATYVFEGSDSVTQYARLRLVPADGSTESGLPDDTDQQDIWKTERREGVTVAADYLRREYRSRLRDSPIQYRLQLQLHPQTRDFKLVSPHNPWARWKPADHPWHDLAVITITTNITEKSIARTSFSLKHHPKSFRLPESKSMKDFASLGIVLREFHGVRNGEQGLYTDSEDKEVKYKLKVLTGKVMNAGTDADVYITLTGNHGRTPALELSKPFHDDFEAGQEDEFDVTCSEVGEVVCVEMNINSLLSARKWFLEEVVVMEDGGSTSRFPCYQWLTHTHPAVTLRPANPMAPFKELALFAYLQRKYEIFVKRHRYQWEKMGGLPGRIKTKGYQDLPEEAKFQMEKDIDLTQKYLRTLANSGTGNLFTMIGMWNIIEDNPKLLTKFLKQKDVVKRVVADWRTDEEFGRQVLNGPHPTRIRRVTSIPKVFVPVEHVHIIESVMGEGITLDEHIQAGRVYCLEYPELETLKKSRSYKGKYRRYITSPTCLLHVRDDGALVPVAIHLGNTDLVWTPKDSPEDWLMAKMWVRESDAQVHQVVSRHLHNHLFMETIAMATGRNLSSAHPVYKLLLPHLRYTLAVNTLGREHMYPAEDGLFERYLAVGGQHNKLMRNAYKSFHIDRLNVPKDMKSRGVMDRDALPGYHYRDDALRLWGAIHKYVRTVLVLHYWSDDGVRADEELQDWVRDLWENGLPVWRDELADDQDDSESDGTPHEKEDTGDEARKTTEEAKSETKEPVKVAEEHPEPETSSRSIPLPSVSGAISMAAAAVVPKRKLTLKEMAIQYKVENPKAAEEKAALARSPPQSPMASRYTVPPSPEAFRSPASPGQPRVKASTSPSNSQSVRTTPTRSGFEVAEKSDEKNQVSYDSDFDDFVDHGVPKYFSGIFDLAEFVTTLIFTASCQHAALTFGSMDYYGYVPNAPTMLLAPPMTVKGKLSMSDIKKSLPSKGKTAEIISAFYTLSRVDSSEVFLDQFPEKYFDDERMLQTILAFKEDLKNVTNEIEERNQKLEVPYTYLIPSQIPKSVSM